MRSVVAEGGGDRIHGVSARGEKRTIFSENISCLRRWLKSIPPGTYSVTKWSFDADWKAHSSPRMKGWRTWRGGGGCVEGERCGGVM